MSEAQIAARPPRRLRISSSLTVPILCWLAFCTIGLYFITTNRFPQAFDELEHVSYAAFLQETHRWLPKFEDQQTLSVGDLRHWDNRSNYLGHPSFFYDYISLFLDRTLTPDRAVLRLRLASFALLLAGMALAIAAGWRRFRQDPCAAIVFCLLVSLCPKLLAVAGQVSNDALGFLGGALAYWGANAEGRRKWPGIAAASIGLVFALWSKPNAGLAVGMWLAIFALLQMRQRRGLMLGLAVSVVVGTVPYWFILSEYGKLVPITVEQFGHVRQLDGFGSYVPAFIFNVAYTWCYAQPGTWPITNWGSYVAVGLVWLLLLGAVIGGLRAIGHKRSTTACIAAASIGAFAVMVPIHFWFSATRLGFSLPAISFRYYLPLWPPLAHAFSYGMVSSRGRRPRAILALIAAAALLVGWISPT